MWVSEKLSSLASPELTRVRLVKHHHHRTAGVVLLLDHGKNAVADVVGKRGVPGT